MLPDGQEGELMNKATASLLSAGSAFSIESGEVVKLEPTSPDSLIATAGGIEFLIKLAERGEIDPADVDIIDVTDRFLRAIAAAPKENLRQSGKVLFHASVLLRMKAEALLARRSDVVDDMGDDFLDFDPDGPLIYDSRKQAVARQITLDDLEKALVRRANNRQNRQRKVTLDQLVSALKEAEKIERTRADRKPKSRIQTLGYADVSDVDDILELAHDEDIEMVIGKVDRIFDERVAIGESIDLLMLIKLMGTKTDWVDAFLAILFLSNAGKIALEQKDFYGSLHIVRCEPKNFEQKLVVIA
jgi:segregation and condensation protein A